MGRHEIVRGRPLDAEPNALHCPRCGHGRLHQSKVSVFERREDATTLEVVVTAPGDCKVKLGSANNPSSRRNAVVIQFWCEFCGEEPEKLIERVFSQHKGVTEAYWRYDNVGAI